MGSPASLPAGPLTPAPSFAKAALSAANGVASSGAMADRRSTSAGSRASVSVTGSTVGAAPDAGLWERSGAKTPFTKTSVVQPACSNRHGSRSAAGTPYGEAGAERRQGVVAIGPIGVKRHSSSLAVGNPVRENRSNASRRRAISPEGPSPPPFRVNRSNASAYAAFTPAHPALPPPR